MLAAGVGQGDCIFVVYYLGLMARQDYFTHFEPSQLLVGGMKMGDPREKTPNHL